MRSPDPPLAVAVDIGGTFTDIALHEPASGRIWRAKTPSVPRDPSQAFMAGMRLALGNLVAKLRPKSSKAPPPPSGLNDQALAQLATDLREGKIEQAEFDRRLSELC